MNFMDSYKWLEKLCSELCNDSHGVTAYIDEMVNIYVEAYYIWGWEER